MSRILTDTQPIRMHAPRHDVDASWAHAATCLDCRLLLTRDDEVRRRLALLRLGEPRINVVDQVMEQISQQHLLG